MHFIILLKHSSFKIISYLCILTKCYEQRSI
nr:MAG TPA: hypothetical protein [Caudoviricetes sp.]